jgi:hypothetical protein
MLHAFFVIILFTALFEALANCYDVDAANRRATATASAYGATTAGNPKILRVEGPAPGHTARSDGGGRTGSSDDVRSNGLVAT